MQTKGKIEKHGTGWIRLAVGVLFALALAQHADAADYATDGIVTNYTDAAHKWNLSALRQAVTELGNSFPGQYPAADFLRRLDELERNVDATEMARCKRLMLVDANPLLKCRKLLFVKRNTYGSFHYTG